MTPKDVGLLIILRWCVVIGGGGVVHRLPCLPHSCFFSSALFFPSKRVVREHGDGGGERTIATDGGAGDDGCGRREHEREPRVEIHTYPHPPPAPTSIIYGACLYYTTKMGLARITITESLNSVAAP